MEKRFLTFLLGLITTLTLSAQGGITEVGATSPHSEATTTYDMPGGPNHAPGGPHKTVGGEGVNPGGPGSPVGAPWVLLGFAAAYAGYRLVRRKG